MTHIRAIVIRLICLAVVSLTLVAVDHRSAAATASLVDHRGKSVSENDLRGRYLLVMFGYTHCPDVCPTGLLTMTDALRNLSPSSLGKILPVFVTFDPARDTPGHLAEYVAAFHPRLVGLTGSKAVIDRLVHDYSVIAVRRFGQTDREYYFDHTALFYLIGPDGAQIAHFAHSTPAELIAQSLEKRLSD